MNGCVINGTPIAVDFWRSRECPSAKLFFLTHLHGDHVVGLTSSWQHAIYCSEITAKLLFDNYGIHRNLVKPLSIGQNHIIYLDEESQEQMVVTVIDANHCPGAVMFVFEGYFGKILYTGDFRYHKDFFNTDYRPILTNIDDLYLDNTFCEPSCLFPSVKTAVDEIFSIIRSHPNHDILIGVRKLGKEDLLLKIALEFREWISIPANLNCTVNILDYPNVFKVNDKTCRIRVVPFHSVTKNYIEKLNKVEKTIAILPTGLFAGLSFEPYCSCEDIYVVNYSSHSSYTELLDFVKILAPKNVKPIVKGNSKGPFGVSLERRADMSCFSSFLSNEQRKEFVIPDTVKKMMSTRLLIDKKNNRKRKRPLKLNKRTSKGTQKGVMFEDFNDISEKTECETSRENSETDKYIENGWSENVCTDRKLTNDGRCQDLSDCKSLIANTEETDEFVSLQSFELSERFNRTKDGDSKRNKSEVEGNDTHLANKCLLGKLNVEKSPTRKPTLHRMDADCLIEPRNKGLLGELDVGKSLTRKPALHQMDADCLIESEDENNSSQNVERPFPCRTLIDQMDEDCFIEFEEGKNCSHLAVERPLYHRSVIHQMDTDCIIEPENENKRSSEAVTRPCSYRTFIYQTNADCLIESKDENNHFSKAFERPLIHQLRSDTENRTIKENILDSTSVDIRLESENNENGQSCLETGCTNQIDESNCDNNKGAHAQLFDTQSKTGEDRTLGSCQMIGGELNESVTEYSHSQNYVKGRHMSQSRHRKMIKEVREYINVDETDTLWSKDENSTGQMKSLDSGGIQRVLCEVFDSVSNINRNGKKIQDLEAGTCLLDENFIRNDQKQILTENLYMNMTKVIPITKIRNPEAKCQKLYETFKKFLS